MRSAERLPARLHYARERMNLPLREVQKAIGIGQSSLSEFENGKREPSLSQLQKLAKYYGRSLSFFLEEGPIPREAVLWRERPADSSEKIESEFLRLSEQYRNLEVWCNEVVTPSLPTATGSRETFGFVEADRLARNVHSQLHLGDRPGCELLRVIEEDCGIKVFHLSFEPSGVAASTKSDRFGMGVLLNSKNVRWRRNFDLAHELFHLLTWQVFRSAADCSSEVADTREEQLANSFAASLLMPGDAVRTAVGRRAEDNRLSYESLFDIAREFDVSVESLMWRLHWVYEKGAARTDETKEAIEKAKALAPVLEDRERDDTDAPELPERYRALAVKALRRGEMSLGRFADYMNISRAKAMEYAGQETCEREEVQLTSA